MHHEYTVEVQEKLQALRDLIADLRDELQEKDDQFQTYIGNSEAAYASLSDKFKATQRDLHTANARIAELESLTSELAKVAKGVLDECDQVAEQVAYIQVRVIEAAQKRMADLGLSAFELGA